MKRCAVVLAVMWCFSLEGVLLAQAAPGAGAPPSADLKAEARKPTFYEFALKRKIVVHERAVPVSFGKAAFSPLEAREIEFTFVEKDNRLTAKMSCTAVRVLDAVRAVHIALFDEHQRLLGTASAATTITKFIVNNVPASEEVELALDFGESATYKTCKFFQVSISGRGRSSAKFGMGDVEELFERLANNRSPEGQRDAAEALAELGDPVLPRLRQVAMKENRPGSLALLAVVKMGTPAAAAVLDDQLHAGDISKARRLEIYEVGVTMGAPAFGVLSNELQRVRDEGLEVALFRTLGALKDPRVGPFLIECFKDETRYIGLARAEAAISLAKHRETAAVPFLIAALRDRSGTVRVAAAYAVEEITRASVPIEWTGSSADAWLNAPIEARESAAQRWEEWWKTNSAKFGMR